MNSLIKICHNCRYADYNTARGIWYGNKYVKQKSDIFVCLN